MIDLSVAVGPGRRPFFKFTGLSLEGGKIMAELKVRPGGGMELAGETVEFLENALMIHRNQAAPPELSAVEGFDRLHAHIRDLKEILVQFSNGHFECQLAQGGATVGYIKALQSNIRHLAWQCYRVTDGDFRQRVDFMGELSNAFNRMIEDLAEKQRIIDQKQGELYALAQDLRLEIKRKEEIEAALRASEAAYREKAMLDSLTGLYNRGYFFEAVSREMENLKRRPDGSFCLLMVDIDFFKKYNDTYGHLMGDQAIKAVSAVMGQTLRKSDVLARYGGEEFGIFLDNTSLNTGLMIAERIRDLVASQPNPAGPETPPLTISLGLCCVENRLIHPGSPGAYVLSKALAQADAALYEAKKNGRNQVRSSVGLGAPLPDFPAHHESPGDGQTRRMPVENSAGGRDALLN
jgi:diguanylate cyclase (GGDEF)-like protein